MFTREQVLAAVRAAFPQDSQAVVQALDRYGTESCERERERVQLAIVALSGGDRAKLGEFVKTAKLDYRDVLHWHDSGPPSPEEGERQRQAAQKLLHRWGRKT